MRYLSVCSGIEAATVAWHDLGWEAAAFAEIEKFPCAVLAHHYPGVPNLGDFTKIEASDVGPVDLLVGGTPCQDFSVAGLRAGLAGDRGALTIEFLHLARRLRPKWVVWENVPGVLSADDGRAFGAFLRLLGELGYGFAYRVLDAQFFGVPQRRRRVFVVGCLGDWRSAAAVLFERDSLSGNPPPRRKARGVTPSLTSSGAGVSRVKGAARSDDAEWFSAQIQAEEDRIAKTLQSREGHGGVRPDSTLVADAIVAGTLRASASGVSRVGNGEVEMLVTHSLRAEGFDASEDGTGRGVPLVAQSFAQNSRDEVRFVGGDGDVVGALGADVGSKQQSYIAFSCKDDGADAGDDVSPTMRSMSHAPNCGSHVAVAFTNQVESPFEEDTALPVTARKGDPGNVAYQCQGSNVGEMGTLRVSTGSASGGVPFVDETLALRNAGRNGDQRPGRSAAPTTVETMYALQAEQTHAIVRAAAVRRLTPRECERLQGFPDDYTLVPWRGNMAADGPRYKSLGNSMAVPCMAWIGGRIARVDREGA